MGPLAGVRVFAADSSASSFSATTKPIDVRGANYFRVTGGKITRMENFHDKGAFAPVEWRIDDAPAAVTRVSEAEIQQQAAHAQLPKLLEFTPDPFGDWAAGRLEGLVQAELESAGLRRPMLRTA